MRRRQRLAYLGRSFSIGIFNAFNNFTLSIWLTGFTASYIVISLLSSSKSVEGAIVSPITGAVSDRTWAGWLGRRRVFILGGGLTSALLLALTPTIASWTFLRADFGGWLTPEVARFIPIVLAIFLFTLAFNMADDVHHAMLGDLTEGAERNQLAALSTVADIGAQMGILLLLGLLWRESVPDVAFWLVGALMAAGVLLTVFGVREPPPVVWEASRTAETHAVEAHSSLRSFLAEYRGAAIFCLVNLVYWCGLNAVIPLFSPYLMRVLGATAGEAQVLPALLLLTTALAAVPVGWLGTRLGKQRVMMVGFALMGLGALIALFITTKEQASVALLIFGVANTATIVLRVPVMADLVPRHHLGAAVGALAAAGSIGAPLGSIVAGALADAYGLRAIFSVVVVAACVALALMPLVRQPARVDAAAGNLVPEPV
jgi:MFS family permease